MRAFLLALGPNERHAPVAKPLALCGLFTADERHDGKRPCSVILSQLITYHVLCSINLKLQKWYPEAYINETIMVYTVEPRNADTSGTNLKCPDFRGVLYSGVGTFYHYNEYII